tara:strand:- start:56834 stop:57565 length:732 start_codon:yes stop_codon:yes gene_type:complete
MAHTCITPCIELDISKFTDGTVDGTGVFDVMMQSAREHLKREHDAGRITGDRFADVYMTTMQAVLGQANQFVLMKDKIDYEVSILSRQATLLEEQANLAIIQTEVAESTKQNNIDLIASQLDKLNKEIVILQAQNTLTLSNIDKTNTENDVLTQRVKSEEAQTKDDVDGVPVAGILGKQMTLFDNQAEGYIRDAEQKTAKIMSDAFVTRVSTDYDQANASNAGLDDANINSVMHKLKLGIGLP